MLTIHKYELDPGRRDSEGQVRIRVPAHALFLSVQNQYNRVQAWFLHKAVPAQYETRTFRIHGTGNPVHFAPKGYELTFRGTVQMPDSRLVWHIFEEVPK